MFEDGVLEGILDTFSDNINFLRDYFKIIRVI